MNNKTHVEIERKWLVNDWPDNLSLLFKEEMRQGYIVTSPTVRIRQENTIFSNVKEKEIKDSYILCFKSKGSLVRKEIEMAIDKDKFIELEDLIGLPLINKKRNTYLLKDGHHLEVNQVDEGLDSEFFYAEIEFKSIEDANNFKPEDVGLDKYLTNEVTLLKGQSMAAYWNKTRLK